MDDLLIISDLHLGEDIGAPARRTLELERQLVAFLDHYGANGSWRLVINGDMLELAGLTLLPSTAGWVRGLHPHDHAYGLGAREAAAVLKLRAITQHHWPVFRALARFVARGNRVSIVIGNHDAELHWPEVQRTFCDALERAATEEGVAGVGPSALTFHPWFFHQPGAVWVEHGHQYDAYCSFEHPLAPSCDGREIDPNVGYLLMRYICAAFDRDVHFAQGRGFFGLVRVWLSQRPDRFLRILRGYIDMCSRLFEHCRSRQRAGASTVRHRGTARLQRLASESRLEQPQLEALAGLWVTPVVDRPHRLLRALMLDRVSLMLMGPLLLASTLFGSLWSVASLLLLVGWVLWAVRAREPMHPAPTMRDRVDRIMELAQVSHVVMGHSHEPCHERHGHGVYLNSGTWAPHGDPATAFTHVRLRHRPNGVEAELCQWRDDHSHVLRDSRVCLEAPVVAPPERPGDRLAS